MAQPDSERDRIHPEHFAALERAVRRRLGESVHIDKVVTPTVGAMNRTIIFDCVEGTMSRRLVSREETIDPDFNPFLRSERQFEVIHVAHRHGIPTPTPVFVYDAMDDLGPGFVTEFIQGETLPRRILSAASFAGARSRFASQAGSVLARLHSIATSSVEFLRDEPDSRSPLAALKQRFDSYDEPHPAIEVGLRWLERNEPSSSARAFLHGDFRLGNLMMDEAGLAAVLDWECSHIGNPMQDLGWLCMRPWRFGNTDRPVAGMADRQTLFDAYEAEAGVAVCSDEVRYWEIFGLVRWAILNVMQGYGHVRRGRRSLMFAAQGRNVCLVEYDLLMTLNGHYD